MLWEMCKGKGVIYCITCKKGNITPSWLCGQAKEKVPVCGAKRKLNVRSVMEKVKFDSLE